MFHNRCCFGCVRITHGKDITCTAEMCMCTSVGRSWVIASMHPRHNTSIGRMIAHKRSLPSNHPQCTIGAARLSRWTPTRISTAVQSMRSEPLTVPDILLSIFLEIPTLVCMSICILYSLWSSGQTGDSSYYSMLGVSPEANDQ